MPEFEMPTDEECRTASAEWLKPLRPCLYTYWPERYKELSFPTMIEQLSPKEIQRLIDTFNHKPLGTPQDAALRWKLKRGLAEFDSGSFFKLESRSPKDNYWGIATNFRACNWRDIEKMLYSERIMDDLCRYKHTDEPLRLLFREWHSIRKDEEFRCFIRDRKLVGISQYHYAEWDEWNQTSKPPAFRNIIARKDEIGSALAAFVNSEIIPHLPVEDLVADLWRDPFGKITLIEINPYGLSDPCLFTYEELETASGEFRIVSQQ
jgi:hypothetical protein